MGVPKHKGCSVYRETHAHLLDLLTTFFLVHYTIVQGNIAISTMFCQTILATLRISYALSCFDHILVVAKLHNTLFLVRKQCVPSPKGVLYMRRASVVLT